jgi:glycosyltransferase involved in cell wall biosynthesis
MVYPWGDLLVRHAGASQRCNLVLDALAPRAAAIAVLQDAGAPAVRQGNLHIESAPHPRWNTLARRAFLLLAMPLVGGRAGLSQARVAWIHLERLIDPGFWLRVRRLVREADAVLVEYSLWAPVVLRACRRRRIPVVLTQHDVMSDQVTRSRPLRRLTLRLELAALRAADHAVCVSAADQEAFRRHGVEARLIPNPVDAERLALPLPAAPRRLLQGLHGIALPEGTPLALFVGSHIEPNRRAVERIRAMAPACPGVTFVLAGTCAAPGREGNLVAMGPVGEVALVALYRLASVMVVPLELGTGSSLKTVEALATGAPVLGTAMAFRGLRVTPGTDCVVEDDLARWPSLVAGLLAAPARAAAIGAAGRDFVRAYEHRRVFAAYAELLGLPPAPPEAAEAERRHRAWGFALECLEQAVARGALPLAAEILAGLPRVPPPAPARPLAAQDPAGLAFALARRAAEAGQPALARQALA